MFSQIHNYGERRRKVSFLKWTFQLKGTNPKSSYKIRNVFGICGSSSGVERLLAKQKVEGSNPFSRSKGLRESLKGINILSLSMVYW